MLEIKQEDGEARTGVLKLNSGKVKTPFFMPVGTKGGVKNLTPEQLEDTGTECLISNAFILSLRPGVKSIADHGGLHEFMKWKKGIFTDSGGFQILSKDFLIKKSEKGVYFKNPYGGDKSMFTPEDSIKIQNLIGSDVAMCLDDVPHYGKSEKYMLDTLNRTTDWALRCKEAHANEKQLLFGIGQGGIFPELRKKSAQQLNKIGFDGYALGGLCIGESKKELFNSIAAQVKHFDKDKPKYVMGMGSPDDIVEAVSLGADCFDSIYPTKNARHGSLFTKEGTLKMKSRKYNGDTSPIEEGCKCYACKNYSKGFVHHMLIVHEQIGKTLAAIHNLTFMQNFMEEIREAIRNNTFDEFKKEFLANFNVENKVNNR